MPSEPLEVLAVKDATAAARLHALLTGAAQRLAALRRDPVLVAAAPNKFNDSFQDDLWFAVQAGRSFWQQSHFFNEQSAAEIVERTHIQDQLSAEAARRLGSQSASGEIAMLRQVLQDLEKAGWRALADQALEGNLTNVLCLAIQQGQTWLCRTWPVEDEGDAWICAPDGGFHHFGRCNRLDDQVGQIPPLEFKAPHSAALAALEPQARAYFVPHAVDRDAERALAALLETVAFEARAVTDRPLRLDSPALYYGQGAFHRAAWARMGRIVWNGECVNFPGATRRDPKTRLPLPRSPEVIALEEVRRRLDQAGWKNLFASAYGTPLVGNERLNFLIGPNHALLLRGNTVLRLRHGTLSYAGLCEPLGDRQTEAPPDEISRLP